MGYYNWGLKIGRLDILLEVSILSLHLAIQDVYHIFSYLKQVPKRKLYLDPVLSLISEDHFHKFDWEDFYRNSKEAIPDGMPKPRGKIMTTHCFVDANHAADKVKRRLQTGILIFFNQVPILWFSKRYNSVESSTFVSEFTALNNAVELVTALR